ncbi:MAG: DUF2914 domain-containing protein [Thermodesulfobacteriota bacterium]|nr:DUF2914 domain-containing protein [Thermodesulfobacteriota bacterium]
MMSHKNMTLILLVVLTVCGILFSAYGQEKPKQEQVGMTIARLVVGTGVEKGEPGGVAEKFPATMEKVYCFLEAKNIPKDTEISFIWLHGQKELLKTTLPLKMGPKWRTYAHKNLRGLKGDWKVEIKDANGNLIKDVKFKVE